MKLKNYSLALAALLFSINGACFAQSALPQLPDTPAANQAKGWLEVFNAGDVEKRRAFLQKNYPSRLERFDRETEMRRGTGGFDVVKVAESTPTKIVLLIRERLGDQAAQFTVEVEPAPPHAIKQFQFQVLPRTGELAIPHLSESELVTSLRKRVDEVVAADLFSGAVLIAKDGKTVFAQAYGLADRENKTPNTLKTRFRLGSMNKMFTAVATLQLVQNGKLDLKAPFGNYLTDYPNKDVASKVTIEQMLTHTGGTGDIFGPEFDKNRLELKTLQDYVKLYGNRGPEFEPGSRWQYSNYGFLLLGVIVEKVSGQNYYDYVRDHIFKPAGMNATASEPEDQVVADRSVGYMRSDGAGWQRNNDTLPYRGTSAGGGYSTVEDLLKFATALQTNKLLNPQYTEMLTTGKVQTPNGGKYAYGFQEATVNGTRCFGHGGGAPGMNGELKICPGPGYVVAVLANLDPPAATRVADFITNRLPIGGRESSGQTPQTDTRSEQTIVIVHGAWGGSWAFKKVDSLLRQKGFEVYRPQLTGQGDRVHLARPDIGLSTHIDDVVNMILYEDLRNIILVGHSYGGMVISGVADRVPDRIKRLVYLDALVPNDGDSVSTMLRGGADFIKQMTKGDYIVPPWVKPDQLPPHDVPQSLKTFTDPIVLQNEAARKLPATYILTVEKGKEAKDDDFFPQSQRAKERGWSMLQLTSDHNPQWSAPEALVEMLAGIR